MPSEWWARLRSQGLGVCCGLATVLLLAIGSFVLAATRGGASAGIALDDVRLFFTRPSFVHLWFYALIPVLTLYGINTFLATLHSVTTKWRNGMRDPQMFAAAFFHVGFLLALLAHLIGGFGGTDAAMLIDEDWRPTPAGTEIRLIGTDVERLPGGMPKSINVKVELRDAAGRIENATLGFNQPLTSEMGNRLVLLQRPVSSTVLLLAAGDERCAVHLGDQCSIAGTTIRLAELRDSGTHGTLARVVIDGRESWLMRGMGVPLDDSTTVSMSGIEERSAVFVRLRYAPGNIWALSAAVFLVIGVMLMWRRFV